MWNFFYRISKIIWVPVGWTLLTIFLLCLPGTALPGIPLFNIPHFDKLVHVILFGGIVFFWVFYFENIYSSDPKNVIIMLLLSSALGVVMEFIQADFVPNRSFDGGDILADAAGSLFAGITHCFLLRKSSHK